MRFGRSSEQLDAPIAQLELSLDFERLFRGHEAVSFFVTRAKSNLKAERRYAHPVDRASGLICDQTVISSGYYSHQGFSVPLRCVKYIDPKIRKRLVFQVGRMCALSEICANLARERIYQPEKSTGRKKISGRGSAKFLYQLCTGEACCMLRAAPRAFSAMLRQYQNRAACAVNRGAQRSAAS